MVPADLAQVTYTSGSSADPRAWCTRTAPSSAPPVASPRCGLRATGPTVFFCAFPFFWIGGTLVLGAALQSGATVLVIERFEPGAALDLIERERATAVLGWPTLIQAMRDHPSFPAAATSPTSRASPSVPPTWPSGHARARHPRPSRA